MTKRNQTKQPRASYTHEFREESIHMALGVGCEAVGIMETARRLSIPLSTLSRWIDSYRKSGEVKASSRQCTPEASELSRLKRELHSLKIENEILKKAAAYFAKESFKSTPR